MSCPGIEPNLVAEADQHIAMVGEFLDGMVRDWRQHFAHHDSVAVCKLSLLLNERLTAKYALSDALALAISRLPSR